MDGIEVEVNADALIAAIQRLGNARADAAVDRASLVTANNIVREARSRLERQLGPDATGKTTAGIQIERADRGGYIVGSRRDPFPNLPLWIEKGTKKGTRITRGVARSGGNMKARPYFYDSAELEEQPHLQRVSDELQAEFDAEGLGE